MIKEIDFTNCEIIKGKFYNGANGKKIAIKYNNLIYMLKFPPNCKDKATDLSYTNSCFSEHIASSIFNIICIKAQETILGTYKMKDKIKCVCACLDFTSNNLNFFDYCSLKNSTLDSDSDGSGTELSEILDTIDKQNYIDKNVLLNHFWEMFVGDILVGNFDRHNGN